MLRWVVIAFAIIALGLPASALEFDRGAEQVALSFMKAWAAADKQALAKLTPATPAARFGPCLFASLPVLSQPRVDAHRAAVDFAGKARDGLPSRGIIVLTRVDEEPAQYRWKVRQILWMGQRALGVRVPRRSVTKADQAQEAAVLRAAQAYLQAWAKHDYQAMERLWYDRLKNQSKPRSYFRLRSAEFTASPTREGELKVGFTAKVTVLRVVPQTVTGTFYMLKEGGEWKVRSHTLAM